MDEKNLVADDLIYIEDVIDMFGNKASKNVIYAWIRQKQLPALKVGKRYVFSMVYLRTLEKSRKEGVAALSNTYQQFMGKENTDKKD